MSNILFILHCRKPWNKLKCTTYTYVYVCSWLRKCDGDQHNVCPPGLTQADKLCDKCLQFSLDNKLCLHTHIILAFICRIFILSTLRSHYSHYCEHRIWTLFTVTVPTLCVCRRSSTGAKIKGAFLRWALPLVTYYVRREGGRSEWMWYPCHVPCWKF